MMRSMPCSRLLLIFPLALFVIVPVGCGKPATSAAATSKASTVPRRAATVSTTSISATATPTASSSGSPLSPTVRTTPPSSSVFAVTLTVDASLARRSGLILVTVNNQSASSITFPDHQTNCSVILLQRQINSVWQSQGVCKLMTPIRLLSLAAGQQLTVRLMGSVQTQFWLPGHYRASLTYQTASHSQVLLSADFQVLATG